MRKFHVVLFLFVFILVSCSSLKNNPTPTATTAPSGSILFEDEFDSVDTGWKRVSLPNGVMDYDGGVYHMFVTAPNINLWSAPKKEFADVQIDVDSAKLDGPDENRMGVICRYKNGDYYFFVITSDGFYAIGKFLNQTSTILGQYEMQVSSAIKTGVALNHLRAKCVGDTLTFLVNEVQLASVKDSDLSSGGVGLIAGSFAEPNVNVIFDHFVVKQP